VRDADRVKLTGGNFLEMNALKAIWMRKKQLFFLLFLIAADVGLGSVDPLLASEKVTAHVIVADVMGFPGKPMRLEARVMQKGFLNDVGLGGEVLGFFVHRKRIGTVMTGGDGRAFLEYVPRMRGNFVSTVRLQDSPRVSDAEGTGVVASWERRRPILLIDLNATMAQQANPDSPLPSLPVIFGLTSLGPPVPEAANELEKLGKYYYNLIYLIQSQTVSLQQVREWLRAHEFPPGIPKVLKPGRKSLEGLLDLLSEQGWKNVSAGIGRTVEFADVLVKRRLKTVIVGQRKQGDEFPRRTVFVKNWKKIRRPL